MTYPVGNPWLTPQPSPLPPARPAPMPTATPFPAPQPTPGGSFADHVPDGYESPNVQFAPGWNDWDPWQLPEPEPTPPAAPASDPAAFDAYWDGPQDAATGARWLPLWVVQALNPSVSIPGDVWVRDIDRYSGLAEFWDDGTGTWIPFRYDV